MDSIQIIDQIEITSQMLWQGKWIEVEEVTELIDKGIQLIIDSSASLYQQGIEFPMEYVSNAMKNLKFAIQQKDDYLLADNLYYEWKEIFTVYQEIVAEL